MVVDCGYRVFCRRQRCRRQQEEDFNCRMRTKFVQTLADYQLELNGLRTRYEFEKAKPVVVEVEDDEYIDVTGDDDPAEVQPKIIPNLEQPPSKIYYDNIEKESSDGGFFDRDDLEDEDEKNDLIIDCKLNNNGETGEKKTESGRSGEKSKPKPPTTTATTEPELVFNFTVVDTQLVYSEPTSNGLRLKGQQQDLRCAVDDKPVVSITVPPPPPPSKEPPAVQQQKQSLLAAKLKEVRIHPYARRSSKLSNRIRRVVEYSPSVPMPVQNYAFHPAAKASEPPIGSRFRPSAFSPPARARIVPQSVQLKPSVRPSTNSINPSSGQLPAPQMLRKPPKKLYRQLPQAPPPSVPYPHFDQYIPVQFQPPIDKQPHPPERLLLPPVEIPLLPRYLPPQFGFGSSALHNLYDPEQPLDFSKNSLLSQYESMLKCSQQQQLRQGHSILRSMPIPTPPKPPKCAYRPQVVPWKEHPTLYQVYRPPVILRPSKKSLNPYPKPATAPEPPVVVPTITEQFRQHMNHEIEKFFARRQNEIFHALRLYASERIDLDELFRQVDHFQLRFGGREYHALAATMVQRYGYQVRGGSAAARQQLAAYRFKEPPQSFAEYFNNVKDSLRPDVSEETLNIYRIVIGSLLEQFRDSLEYFLSRALH